MNAPPPPKRTPTRLTPARVVDAAAAVADVDGLAAVTLARIAAAVGVKPPSLYVHVPGGLDDVLRQLRLRALRAQTAELLRATAGKSRGDALRALADAQRRFARRHPGLHAATARIAPDDGDDVQAAAAEQLDVVRAVVAGYGLAGDDAIHAIRALRAAVRGFIDLELAGGFGMPQDVDESWRRLLDLLERGLCAG